ncbi:MAG TPA: HEAT repeat domain-containing protein [Caulobacteraceae bacterium]
MNTLLLLWWTTIALAGTAIVWMTGLIVARWFRQRADARYAAERLRVDKAIVSLLGGGAAARAELVPNPRKPHAVAEALVEVLGLVRGADRERLLAGLRGLAVDEAIRKGARRGALASRLICIEALTSFPDPKTDALLRDISTSPGDHDCRLAAVRALADMGADLSISRLLDAMIYDGLVASGPVIELLHIMARRWPADLVGALKRLDMTPRVRPLVVEAMGETGDYSVIPNLIEAAEQTDFEVRAAAVRALGKLAHPAAEPALAKAMSDEAWPVRALACHAAGRSGLTSLIDPLGKALDDPVWWVRHRAAGSLLALGPAGRARLTEVAGRDGGIAQATASLALAEQAK